MSVARAWYHWVFELVLVGVPIAIRYILNLVMLEGIAKYHMDGCRQSMPIGSICFWSPKKPLTLKGNNLWWSSSRDLSHPLSGSVCDRKIWHAVWKLHLKFRVDAKWYHTTMGPWEGMGSGVDLMGYYTGERDCGNATMWSPVSMIAIGEVAVRQSESYRMG